MTEKVEFTLHINGRDYPVRVEPRKTLVDVIRDECGQTGTHIGCEHGICGACTVILDGEAVRSCLMFAIQAQGKPIRTVEGLAEGDKLHPLQSAFIAEQAAQCGYCTNGMIMSAKELLDRNPRPSEQDVRTALAENLCRCGTHARIVKAVKRAARDARR